MAKRRSPSAPEWQVILEGIRSDNRVVHEALLMFRVEVEKRFERLEGTVRDGFETHGAILRQHSSDLTELKRIALRHGADIVQLQSDVAGLKTDVAELKTDVAELKTDVGGLKATANEHSTAIRELKLTVQENTLELRALSQKVDNLARLESRVSALERRSEGPDGTQTPPPA